MSPKNKSYHTLRDLFFVFFKQKKCILLIFILTIVVAAGSSFMMQPIYKATSKLAVKDLGKESPEGLDAAGQERGTGRRGVVTATAVEMLSGRYLAERVLNAIGIAELGAQQRAGTFGAGLSEQERALMLFRKQLSVTSGNIIAVSFLHPDPVTAAKVVNRLVAEFLDYYLVVQKRDLKYDFFKKQADLIRSRLKESQKQLGLFRNENNISSIQKQKSLLLLQISDLEVEVARTRSRVSEQEGLAGRTKTAASDYGVLQKKIIALKSKEQKLHQHVTQYKLELGRLDKAETRLRELERQVTMDEENYLLYTKKMEEARIASAMDEQKIINFSIIEPALKPIRPVKPEKLFIIGVAVVLGGLAGLFFAFIREYFTHTFDRGDDIEEILNCSAIAAFNNLSQHDMEQLKAHRLSEGMMEKGSRMKTYLTRLFAGKQSCMVLFCAAQKQEGSSTVLAGFALSLAAQGERVLVIDADVRHAAQHRLFQVERENGLTEMLAEGRSFDAVVKQTALDNLSVITSGSQQGQVSAIFESEDFDRLLAEAAAKADWVLVDAAPLDVYHDACIIGPKVDGVALVLQAGQTRWETAQSAANRLKQADARLAGAVLNRQKMHIPAWLYNLL
ncbi:MAG: polysaccharide biosynthesis tyrosine autokinase [Deltaproteobacteria bacterium]|nr:polysaccharide biosynthesis tyrosine autokinase [Deltaproteobacteria bacterium]